VVETAIVEVITLVSSDSAGQLKTPGGQLVIVETWVVYTVLVVKTGGVMSAGIDTVVDDSWTGMSTGEELDDHAAEGAGGTGRVSANPDSVGLTTVVDVYIGIREVTTLVLPDSTEQLISPGAQPVTVS
jgi:hypothetical protein